MDEKSIRQLHRAEKLKYLPYMGSRYYDYPDGQDLLGKLSFTTKTAALVSVLPGIFYSTTWPSPKTYSTRFVRIGKFVVPAVAMAATFTTVTYYATNIRKKDDPWNYVLGGAAAGYLLGPATGIPAISFWSAFYCSFVGYVKKAHEMEGKKIIPEFRTKYFSSFAMRKMDTSIIKDEVGGNWTK